MWQIFEHKSVAKQLKSLPTDILKRYEKWKDVIGLSGPVGVKQIRGFHDEALTGHWQGYRSSRLNRQYRVIYFVESNQVQIKVIRVSAHDYNRR
ncbi:type II toxin-antitoxin system mRNA interferase toxin, RelE/StbE family [Candidatus Sororendozoicomonas aggregata]|uniref:type II toxin-antitoxin system RelE/ParE family toxin n=1 Tax=Candidatus Sororendozoicomonas aggregata TaxID=3073239 RepID=UPI002ED32CE3